MKKKSDTTLSANENKLLAALLEMISGKAGGIKRTANASLIILFWKIGKRLLESGSASHASRKLIQAKSASTPSKKSPSYTDTDNLEAMKKLAACFPDFLLIQSISPFISWEQMKLLLAIENNDARQYYLQLKLKEGLSKEELEMQVASGKYEKGRFKTKSGRLPAITPGLLKKNDTALSNQFKKPYLQLFRELTAPAVKNSNRRDTSLPGECLSLMEDYRLHVNRHCNTALNMLYWEIGSQLNEALNQKGREGEPKKLIREISLGLEKVYDRCFSEKQLLAMMNYASIFSDQGSASLLANSVNWDYITALLPLKQQDAIFYYAMMAAEKGWSIASLRKQAYSKVYEHTPETKEQKLLLMNQLKKPVKTTDIKKQKNSTVQITYIDYKFGNITPDLQQINIFKNRELLQLMTANG